MCMCIHYVLGCRNMFFIEKIFSSSIYLHKIVSFFINGTVNSIHRDYGLFFVLSYFSTSCLSKKTKTRYYGIKGFIIEVGPSSDVRGAWGSEGSAGE